jgi:hypothetical protein
MGLFSTELSSPRERMSTRSPMKRSRPKLDMPPFGSGDAPQDSVSYAVYIRDMAAASLHSHESDRKSVDAYINILRAKELYLKLQNDKGETFTQWTTFCVTPRPYGLGRSSQDIETIISEAKNPQTIALKVQPLNGHGGDRKSEQSKDQGVMSTLQRGSTNAAYLTARIARDYPDIADEMKAGKYPSVRAAAKAAGLLKEVSGVDRLKQDWKKTTQADHQRFLAWLREEGEL